MKKTMAEVAQNLDTKTSHYDVQRMIEQKSDKQETLHMLAQRITFDDMKQFVDQTINNCPKILEIEHEFKRVSHSLREL